MANSRQEIFSNLSRCSCSDYGIKNGCKEKDVNWAIHSSNVCKRHPWADYLENQPSMLNTADEVGEEGYGEILADSCPYIKDGQVWREKTKQQCNQAEECNYYPDRFLECVSKNIKNIKY